MARTASDAASAVDRIRAGIETHDRDVVERALARRVRVVLDDGGAISAVRTLDPRRVADALLALLTARPGAALEPTQLDGRPGAVLRRPGRPIEGLLGFGAPDARGRVDEVRIVAPTARSGRDLAA